MSSDTEREAFEAWYGVWRGTSQLGKIATGRYKWEATQDAWMAWKASRAAIAVQPPAASQPNAALAEQALLAVLNIVRRYLPPDGISVQDAMCEIIGCVDPWPLATPPAASQPIGYLHNQGKFYPVGAAFDSASQPPAASQPSDAVDAERWRRATAMPKAWWLNAMNSASFPLNYGGQTLNAAVDEVIARNPLPAIRPPAAGLAQAVKAGLAKQFPDDPPMEIAAAQPPAASQPSDRQIADLAAMYGVCPPMVSYDKIIQLARAVLALAAVQGKK